LTRSRSRPENACAKAPRPQPKRERDERAADAEAAGGASCVIFTGEQRCSPRASAKVKQNVLALVAPGRLTHSAAVAVTMPLLK